MPHWLLHWLGVDNVSGPAYAWWSGAGSDVAELAIIGAIVGGWRRVNCHVKGCMRIGRVPVEGTPFRVCWRHHPEGKPTHRHILVRHREHQAAKGAA
jgi:hypothetical protein